MAFPTVDYAKDGDAVAALMSVAASFGYRNDNELSVNGFLCGVVANMLQDVPPGSVSASDIVNGTANQILVTNAAGTASEWTSTVPVLYVTDLYSTVEALFTGVVGIGAVPDLSQALAIGHSNLTGVAQYGAYVDPTAAATATTSGTALFARVNTAAAAFTMVNAYGLYVATPVKGAGSAITNVYGLYLAAQSGGATLNYAWYAATTTNASHLTQAGLLTIGAGIVVTTVGLTVSSGGVTVTGNSTITGTLGGVTTLAMGGALTGVTTAALSGALTITQATANAAVLVSTGYSLTGSDATSAVSYAGTWNTSGTPTAFKVAITNTASNAASKLFDFLAGAAGATSLLSLTVTGATTGLLTIDGSGYGAGVASLRLNGLTTAAVTSEAGTLLNAPVVGNPAFWIPVSIAGTIRYVPAW